MRVATPKNDIERLAPSNSGKNNRREADGILKNRCSAVLKFSELKKLLPTVDIRNLESYFRWAMLSQADVRFMSGQVLTLICRIEHLQTYMELANLSTGDAELACSDQDIYLIAPIQPSSPFILRPVDMEDMFQCIRKYVNVSLFTSEELVITEDDV